MTPDDRIAQEQRMESDRIRAALRTQIRARLASLMGRDGFVLEQFDIGEFGIERVSVGAPGLR